MRVYDYCHSFTKGWHGFRRQIYFQNLFPNVNGISSQVPGNLEALAALSLILTSRLKSQGQLALQWVGECY